MKKIVWFVVIIYLLWPTGVFCMPRGKSKELKRIDDHQARKIAQSRIRDFPYLWREQQRRKILEQCPQQEHNQNMWHGRAAHRIRIGFNSTNVKNLEKVMEDLIAGVRSKNQNVSSLQMRVHDDPEIEVVHRWNQANYFFFCRKREQEILEKKPINTCNLLDQPQSLLSITSKEKRYQFAQSYIHSQKQCSQQERMHNKKNKKLPISQQRLQVSHRAKR